MSVNCIDDCHERCVCGGNGRQTLTTDKSGDPGKLVAMPPPVLPWEPHGKLVVAHGWSQPVATGRYWLEHGHSQWQYTDSVCVCIQSSHVHNNTATDTAAACLVFVKSITDWYQQCFEKFLLTDEDYEASLWYKISIQISIVTTLSSSGVSSIKMI